MKYKVGDKVVVKKADKNWNRKMNKWVGKTMTIRQLHPYSKSYKMEEDIEEWEKGWFWDEFMIDHEATKKLGSNNVGETEVLEGDVFSLLRLPIKKVVYNNNHTIVILKDGRKGIAKCAPGDKFDKKTGLLIALGRAYEKNAK